LNKDIFIKSYVKKYILKYMMSAWVFIFRFII